MKIIEYSSQADAAEALASEVSMQLESAISAGDKASIAVPGGSTPLLFLQALARQSLDWTKIRLTTTDERQVALDHPRSNARLINEAFSSNPDARKAFLALEGSLSIDELQEQIQQHIIPLDVCVLGMGNDGHTASLFPGVDNALLRPDGKPLIANTQPPGDLEPRITLSARALLTAPHIHILIHGDEKRAVLEQAINGTDISVMPVRSIFQHVSGQLAIHCVKN